MTERDSWVSRAAAQPRTSDIDTGEYVSLTDLLDDGEPERQYQG